MMNEAFSKITEWAAPRREKLLWLSFVLLTLPHFNPGYLNRCVPIGEMLINAGRVASALVVFVWLILIKRRLSAIVLLIGIWQGYCVIDTIVQHGDIKDCVIVSASVVAVTMLYDLMQDERKIFLSSQLFCFEAMIYINLVTVLLYPKGLYTYHVIYKSGIEGITDKNYFLGYYTTLSIYFIPALLIACLYGHLTGRKLRPWCLTFAIFLTAFRVWSGGTLVALAGMLIAYVGWKYLSKVLNYYSCWFLEIVFFVAVILLRLQNLLRWLLENVLHKWASLMGRINVWDITMVRIREAWLFGYGHLEADARVAEYGKFWAIHAHNQLLELLYAGGIVNLLLFVWIIYVAGKKVCRHKNTLESKYITIAFLGWCLATLVEPYTTPFLVAMFVIAYYSNRDVLQPGEKDPLQCPTWDAQLARMAGKRKTT